MKLSRSGIYKNLLKSDDAISKKGSGCPIKMSQRQDKDIEMSSFNP